MASTWRSLAARVALAGAAGLVLAAQALTACTGTTAVACEPACGTGEWCDRATGACRPSARRAASVCGDCPAARPVCDETHAECVACTTSSHCSSAKPYCDTSVPGARCVACKSSSACPNGATCDVDAGTCTVIPEDAGVGCFPTPDVPCTEACATGYTCLAGRCVLNGADGALQVSVRWDQPVDLDLRLGEPTPIGTCYIWYGSKVTQPECHPEGKLDVDSNPDCKIDGRDLENIIYPDNQPAPSGSYSVTLTYFSRCERVNPVNYEVQVRIGGAVQIFCGTFDATEAGESREITTFEIQ